MRYGLILVLFMGFMVQQVQADSCFDLNYIDQTVSRLEEANRKESWCVRNFKIDGANYKLTYNVDGRILPEMSFLTRTDDKMVSYASRSMGKLRMAMVDGNELNPLPAYLETGSKSKITVSLDYDNRQRIDRIQKKLLSQFAMKSGVRRYLRVRAGTFSSYLTKDKLPWRGYWYPTAKYELARTTKSPMYVFDQIVEKMYPNQKTDAYGWERKYHSARLGWSGHCNGWASASTLTEEPTKTLKDPVTGLLITPMMQKAWLTETHFCMSYNVYGSRYRERGDDKHDIDPALFHKVLIHYIDNLKKPINMDKTVLIPVYNHVISGYSFKIKKIGSRLYRVDARIRAHSYDDKYRESLGVARTYTKLYKYYLRTDRNGVVKSGRWRQREHPDFLWAPLAQKNCDSENPYVTQEIVTELLNLPEAVVEPTE